MSAVPGQPGGPPAAASARTDPGAPPEPGPQADDDTPAVMPGEAPPPGAFPGAPPVATPSARRNDGPAEVEGAAVLGQRSPFAREGEDRAQQYWNPWKDPARSGWIGETIRSPYTVLEGLGSGAAKGEAVLAGVLHADLSPDDAQMISAGLSPDQIANAKKQASAQQAGGADALMADARDRVAALTPDPQTTGAATQIIHGVAEGAELAITGSLFGGAAGAASALSSAEGLARYQDLRKQGVDEKTALESAGLAGVAAGAGAFLPGGFGSTLTARVLTGVGSNVTIGGATRYADHQILAANGYQEMADQQKVWDGTSILWDAILGSIFGGLAHLHAPEAEDAARTVATATNARRSAPGVPVDPQAAAAHQANLNKAAGDLMQGNRVDVSQGPQGDYLERPSFADPETAQVLADSFKETGLLDEEANLAELEAQLSQRRSGTAAQPAAEADRRQDSARRTAVSEMTPEQLRTELLTHELTGIPNRRAYAEAEKLPAQVSIDVDSLKWVNDNLGHQAGDQMLKAVASSLAQHSGQAYHLSGDEFMLQGHTPEEVQKTMAAVSEHLGAHVMEFTMPDGSVKRLNGLGVSFGVGKDFHEAENALQAHKGEREKAGLRAARGEKPPGANAGDTGAGGQAVADRGAESAGHAAGGEPESLANRIARDPDLRDGLTALRFETGWEQEGGRLLMDPEGNVLGRTSWIPREQWWADRPKGLTEVQVHEAVAKALAGNKLGQRQQAIVQFMTEVHDERVQRAGIQAELEANVPDVAAQPKEAVDMTVLSARAADFDADATMRALDLWTDDHPQTIARIQDELERIIGHGHENTAAEPPAVEPAAAGVEEPAPAARSERARDLFGETPTAAQSLADEQRRRDLARSPNRDVSTETGDPSDLFSQARNQVDVVDQALAERPNLRIPAPEAAMERVWQQAAESHRGEMDRAEWEQSTQSASEARAEVDAERAAIEQEAPLATKAAVDCFVRKGS